MIHADGKTLVIKKKDNEVMLDMVSILMALESNDHLQDLFFKVADLIDKHRGEIDMDIYDSSKNKDLLRALGKDRKVN